MEKNTILAIVLCGILLIAGVTVNTIYSPRPIDQKTEVSATTNTTNTTIATTNTENKDQVLSSTVETILDDTQNAYPTEESNYTISTDVLTVVFSNKGGDIVSYKLNKHKENNEPVEMIFKGNVEKANAFSVTFGNKKDVPIDDYMTVLKDTSNPLVIGFQRTYSIKKADGTIVPFTYKKIYTFSKDEYLFKLEIALENSIIDYIPLNKDGTAYTLLYGPQIGPGFEKLDGKYEMRKYFVFTNGKREIINPDKKDMTEVTLPNVSWTGITSKYFALVMIPNQSNNKFAFSNMDTKDKFETSQLFIQRPVLDASKKVDTYYIYLGPKTPDQLERYNIESGNSFKLSGEKIDSVIEYDNILGWLEAILKLFLQFFHMIVPNWGIAIILLTLFVKALTFPLTFKGSQSTARMAELQPKIQEIQAKYKDNPTKMNAEMMEFNKKEGYNPLSGCLPILIQIPIFFAMYNLFNNHFDLRGAFFIPGWIPDLSRAESVFAFTPIVIPIINYAIGNIRLLPIIYLVSQLSYGKFTQQPASGNANQMKFIMYFMPIFFFFFMYDAPSGMLVYWIVSNVLTIIQQVVINNLMKQKKAKRAMMNEPVIVPKKKK